MPEGWHYSVRGGSAIPYTAAGCQTHEGFGVRVDDCTVGFGSEWPSMPGPGGHALVMFRAGWPWDVLCCTANTDISRWQGAILSPDGAGVVDLTNDGVQALSAATDQ